MIIITTIRRYGSTSIFGPQNSLYSGPRPELLLPGPGRLIPSRLTRSTPTHIAKTVCEFLQCCAIMLEGRVAPWSAVCDWDGDGTVKGLDDSVQGEVTRVAGAVPTARRKIFGLFGPTAPDSRRRVEQDDGNGRAPCHPSRPNLSRETKEMAGAEAVTMAIQLKPEHRCASWSWHS